jgi:ABC-type polysaccharide/polyol phosphate export permease
MTQTQEPASLAAAATAPFDVDSVDRLTAAAPANIPTSQRFKAALQDLYQGLTRWELWVALGWNDVRQRYRRSVLGPFWLTASTALMIGGLAYLYSGLLKQSIDVYLPYLAVGILIFSFISSTINDFAIGYILSARPLLQVKTPISTFTYQIIWKNLIIFGHNALIYIFLIFVFAIDPLPTLWLALVGMVVICANFVAVGIVLGGLGARFRDIPPIVVAVMQIAFFLTPIFWRAEDVPNRALIVELNPFYYFVEIVRQPLLGQVPPSSIWLPVIGMSFVNAALLMIFLTKYRSRIPYWL